MASNPEVQLSFQEACGDCGLRTANLPVPLPVLGDDFDWLVRDYDGFRLFMMEELAARFSERRRWTPADMEVVIVESLSVVLDQLSDMLDRIQAEAFLETARRPESVRRLLEFIGYDALAKANSRANIPDATPTLSETEAAMRSRLIAFHLGLQRYLAEYAAILAQSSPGQQARVQSFMDNPHTASSADLQAVQALLDKAPQMVERIKNDSLHRYWSLNPGSMDLAREAGPRAIHTQKRMVIIDDYALRLDDHPLVLHANASEKWTGSWSTIETAVILLNNLNLDEELSAASVGGVQALSLLQAGVDLFHQQRELAEVDWSPGQSSRRILREFIDAYRMTGQEVFLTDAQVVGINISLSVRVSGNFFQSEVRRAVIQALGNEVGGFFEPGKIKFGEDLHASDIVEVLMALDGIEAVCLNRFKRVGKRYPDQSDNGRIILEGLEVAVCDNNATRPERGILRLLTHGGLKG